LGGERWREAGENKPRGWRGLYIRDPDPMACRASISRAQDKWVLVARSVSRVTLTGARVLFEGMDVGSHG